MAFIVFFLRTAVHHVNEFVAPGENVIERFHIHLLILLERGSDGLQLLVDDVKYLLLGQSSPYTTSSSMYLSIGYQ